MAAVAKPTIRNVTRSQRSAESRSTSAGSNKSGLPSEHSAGRNASVVSSQLPEYEYPVPVVVRNTFIDTQDARSASLDEFFEERRIHSSPPEAPNHHQSDDVTEASESKPQQSGISMWTGELMGQLAAAAGIWNATPTDSEYDASFQSGEVFHIPRPSPHVLMLSEALPEPNPASLDVPTLGSAGHYAGACKPCAFLYTKGCENGAQCSFCHLCPPDEKRRRQKEKQAAFKEMRRQKKLVSL